MPSVRTVRNFFGLSCQRQDENELLVSALRRVNMDITQAWTFHKHALLDIAFTMSLQTFLCWGEQRCTWVRFMILQVLLDVRSTNGYFNAFHYKIMNFSCHLYSGSFTVICSTTSVWKQCSFKNHTSTNVPLWPSINHFYNVCKISHVAIMHKTINIRSYRPNHYISSTERFIIL